MLFAPTSALAAASFPRGPGHYLNLATLGLILVVYFIWLAFCNWVDRDARRLDLDRTRWNGLVAGGGLFGLLAFWIVPWFPIAFPLLLALLGTPLALYVARRNALVAPAQMVWTERHLKKLARHYLRLELNVEPDVPSGPEVHFLPSPGEMPDQERPRVRRSQRLRGYPPALELICDAVQRRATELHLEPGKDNVNVRLQIDGVFHDAESLSRGKADAILEVVRTWADLAPAPSQRPQEGTFVAEIDGGRVDFRIRAEPAGEREHVVAEIHDRTQRILRLEQLGMPGRVCEAIRGTLASTSGLVLVCGPEDSGRTTTTYGCLHELDRMRRRILTIESQIHQRLERFEQIQVNPAAGSTYGSALRKLLPGQGPRVVFVGAIEEAETADLIVQRAEEGRLILGATRAHDAVTGLYRLVELGVPPGRLADVIVGVICQRLVRLLCDACKIYYRPDPEAVRRANLSPEKVKRLCRIPEESELRRDVRGQVVPCPACRGIGYRGRIGVFEFLLVTERIRELLRGNAPPSSIHQEAIKGGMAYLQDEALGLVTRGLTSIPEMIQALKE